jgi:plastocyanin
MCQVLRLCLAVVALSLSGLTPASAENLPGTEPGFVASTVTVLMTEYAFRPSEVEVPVGAVTLRLVNAGIRRHTLTVLIDGVEHVSPEVRPGAAAEWQLTFPRPGRYELWCNEYRHLEKGMGGALVATGG